MRNRRKRWQRWTVGMGLGVMLLTELVLRWGFGLGQPMILVADPEIGYYFAPNQAGHRFGHRLQYNAYAQRSEPLEEPKPDLRILMTGDSVLNGGNLTDQADTISEQLETDLQQAGQTAEVLNASAGSWGIGNQWAYLQRFGALESDLLILQIGTHDLIQPTSTAELVGIAPHLPDHRPPLAIVEVWERYLGPRILEQWSRWQPPPPVMPPSPPADEQFAQNLATLDAILMWAEARSLPVWILYTPDRADVLTEKTRNPPYKAEFLDWARSRQLPLIDMHNTWRTLPAASVAPYFRDTVHLTPAGHRAIAAQTAAKIQTARSLNNSLQLN